MLLLMEGLVLDENSNLTEENNLNFYNVEKENTNVEEDDSLLEDINETSEDCLKEKKIFQNGNININDNQSENLTIIHNAIISGGVSSNNYSVKNIVKNNGKVQKEYNLKDLDQFVEFVETVKASEYFAIAVILCVFEYVELDDIHSLKVKLLEELPKVTNSDGEEIAIYKNSYLSINSVLKTIGAQIVVLDSGEHCVSLGESRSTALENLWLQFPDMRSNIARWLLSICNTYEYKTNFDLAQITSAFVNIIKLDFGAGVKHFFSRLYSNSDRYFLLGFIALELYNDNIYLDRVLPYIIGWAESDSSWCWKAAVYVYSNIKDNNERLEKSVRNAIMKRFSLSKYKDLRREILPYIGMLLIASDRLRTLISSIFNELMNNGTYNGVQKNLKCFEYIELLRYGYYSVSSKMQDLPLVVCDNKRQLENLMPIIKSVMMKYNTRQFLFMLLDTYMREISEYSVDIKTINRLKAFFKLLSEHVSYFREDNVLFLKKCDCNVGKQLYEFILN